MTQYLTILVLIEQQAKQIFLQDERIFLTYQINDLFRLMFSSAAKHVEINANSFLECFKQKLLHISFNGRVGGPETGLVTKLLWSRSSSTMLSINLRTPEVSVPKPKNGLETIKKIKA